MASPLDIIILAAGNGTRMDADMPILLHPIGGRPLLQHAIDSARELGAEHLLTVVGHGADQVKQRITGDDITFVEQTQQLGTGHAVQQALPHLRDRAKVLVLYGDVPLIRAATLEKLVAAVNPQQMALLTMTLADPTGYGRILRGPEGEVQAIVEQKDATEEQRKITETNTGILAATADQLREWLPQLSNNNAQGEYYLTDLIALAHQSGVHIHVEQPEAIQEVEGINNRQQQAALERYYQQQQAERLMAQGVTLMDPARFDCRGTLRTGRDVVIDINCVIEGDVALAAGVHIGPNCVLRNSTLGAGARLAADSVLGYAQVEAACTIGPYARPRPGTRLADGAKIGNFVETNAARIGAGSKVNHLSDTGATNMGTGVNIGAGTITCNYDGVNKYQTDIEDDVFVGSNSALVAPVKLGQGSTVGAGSVVTRAVAENKLAIARAKQRNIQGWERPTKK